MPGPRRPAGAAAGWSAASQLARRPCQGGPINHAQNASDLAGRVRVKLVSNLHAGRCAGLPTKALTIRGPPFKWPRRQAGRPAECLLEAWRRYPSDLAQTGSPKRAMARTRGAPHHFSLSAGAPNTIQVAAASASGHQPVICGERPSHGHGHGQPAPRRRRQQARRRCAISRQIERPDKQQASGCR
jgi:hypothetical protein